MTGRSRLVAVAAATALLACLAGWLLWPSGDERRPGADPTATATPAPTPTSTPSVRRASAGPARGSCARAAALPFTPERITIDGVVARAAVVPVPRDSRGVTGVLPYSDKVDFAWDRGGIRPGSPRGNVLLNTHTWADGSALGNRLLEDFDEGDRVVVEGLGGARLCYRVARRIEVLAADGYEPYYEDSGPPRLAFIVCSGTRSAGGEWSHRTIWFARPAR